MKPIKRLRKLGRRMRRLLAPPKPAKPVRPAAKVAAEQPEVNVSSLKRKYARSPLRLEPDRFVLCRIIGNDLHPRHRPGMSRANVEFILRHEPALADCEKRWIVNNNGARNVALRAGRNVAKWVLPWDGNCFLTESAWAEIRDAVLA